jgi:hypothetical protein
MSKTRLTAAAVERLKLPEAGQIEYFDTHNHTLVHDQPVKHQLTRGRERHIRRSILPVRPSSFSLPTNGSTTGSNSGVSKYRAA